MAASKGGCGPDLSQPFRQQTVPFAGPVISYGDRERFFRAHKADELLSPGDRCIDKVSLEKEIVLRKDRQDHGGVFAPL